MKKILLALALILMGGATLSTAQAANAAPAAMSIAQAAQADNGLQLVHGWKHRKRWGWRHKSKWSPKCYYKGHWYSAWYFKKKFGWHFFKKYCGRKHY